MRAAPLSLLCLPCAGASANMYLRWQKSLPRSVRVVPVELPGRGARVSEPCAEDLGVLVAQLCRDHDGHTSGRYGLYGHSMGGLIAYEMAMHWRRLSRPVHECLFASASPAPIRREPEFFAGKDADAVLIADLRRQGGTPEEVFESREILGITLAALRADYRMCAGYRYRPAPPLGAPIHIFAGRQDDIEAERILAWEMETSARFSVRWFDGGHFFIREHQAAVLEAVIHELHVEPASGVNPAASACIRASA